MCIITSVISYFVIGILCTEVNRLCLSYCTENVEHFFLLCNLFFVNVFVN